MRQWHHWPPTKINNPNTAIPISPSPSPSQLSTRLAANVAGALPEVRILGVIKLIEHVQFVQAHEVDVLEVQGRGHAARPERTRTVAQQCPLLLLRSRRCCRCTERTAASIAAVRINNQLCVIRRKKNSRSTYFDMSSQELGKVTAGKRHARLQGAPEHLGDVLGLQAVGHHGNGHTIHRALLGGAEFDVIADSVQIACEQCANSILFQV